MSYTCPDCGKTSQHPEDERQGYCGNCHRFASDRDAIAAVVEYRSPHLTAEDYAFVEANAKRLAAKPMPEHIRLRIARIWNSTPAKRAEGEWEDSQ